jgi:glycosyltransferase involved in cell wall biosynthesis
MADVCLVSAQFPPETRGGAENYVLRAAHGLEDRGYDVAVVTSTTYDGTASLRPTEGTYDGITTWRFYPPNLSHPSDGTGGNPLTKAVWRGVDLANLPAARAVGSVLDRLDPAVVHTNNLFGISTLVGRTVRRRGVRHVHTLHDYGLVCPKGSLLRDLTAPDDERTVCESPPMPCRAYARMRRATLGQPDLVTAPSQHVIDVHRDHGFFEGVETRRIPVGTTGAGDRRTRSGERAVLYVGQHTEAKGLDTLFDAAEELPDVTFHVCGTGPEADRAEDAADRLPNVEHHGFVSERRLAELRQTVAASVVPSIWMEVYGMVVAESFAAGLPVVASDIGGMPELVTPGETGFLFEPTDAAELAERIERLLNDDALRERMRSRALAWARDHTVEAHVDELVRAYGLD